MSKKSLSNFDFPSDPIDMFNKYGFSTPKIYDENQLMILEKFAKEWIYKLLSKWTLGKENLFPLETYHIWSEHLPAGHRSVFNAQNRYLYPDQEIKDVLLNEKLLKFISEIGVPNNELWDDGWGWLGFRFVRPGAGDGYPLSRKAWGKAKNVFSCWLPIVGYTEKETLSLVPKSHLRDYPKYLPTDDKFTKEEYRLSKNCTDVEIFNPNLNKGEIILYHPKTLHSEDVLESNITRLNLELRFVPSR